MLIPVGPMMLILGTVPWTCIMRTSCILCLPFLACAGELLTPHELTPSVSGVKL